MRAAIQALLSNPVELIIPVAVFLAALGVGYLIRRVFLSALHAWQSRTPASSRGVFYEALRGPTAIWVLMLGVHFAIQSSHLPAPVTTHAPTVLIALWILSITLMLMRVGGNIVRLYGTQVPGALPVTTLTQSVVQIAVAVVGILAILHEFGLSIATVLTALGVGGIAVALALQDTLSNLFAGFYVAVAGQVRLGDYIKLEAGQEGYVTDISWRSTTIRALSNNLIIIPNAKLAQAIVTNYHLPDKRLPSQVQVSVGYDCDPLQVERVLLDVAATAAREVPGMLAEPAPGVMLEPGFGDSSITFSLNYSVVEFAQQVPVRSELRKRILLRFRQERIDMPFPTHTVLLHERAAAADQGR